MTHRELIARELAAELSDGGEEDWRRYVSLAQQVEDRLNWQLLPLMVQDCGGELAA